MNLQRKVINLQRKVINLQSTHCSQVGLDRFDRSKFPELYPATLTEFAEPVATDDDWAAVHRERERARERGREAGRERVIERAT